MENHKQDLYRYVVEEFAEDYHEGEMERREFLRRVVLLGGGVGGGRILLTSLGIAGVSAGELAAAQGAGAPEAPPEPGPMVAEDDPDLSTEMLIYSALGFDQMAYVARPRAGANGAGVLVIHENRGLQPHIKDVARRIAKAGYVALAPDLVSKIGGTADITDTAQISTYLAQTPGDDHVANLQEAATQLKAREGVDAQRIGAVGFCFGGGLTWRLSTAMPDLKAAVPFYGPAPDLAKVQDIQAAVMGLYGANDARINAGIPALEEALKAANKTYKIIIYEGAGHAFNNDTGQNYRPDAAKDAWEKTLEWFAEYLK